MLRTLHALAALTLVTATTPAFAKDHHRPPSASQCTIQKVDATAEKIEGKLECAAKARKKGGPVSQSCLAQAESQFNQDFDNAGSNCSGSAGAIEDLVDSCVTILSEDVPASGRCAAKSLDAISEAAEGVIQCLNRPDGSAAGRDHDQGDGEGPDGDGHHQGGEHDTQAECIAKAEADLDGALAKAGSCTDSDVHDDLTACLDAIRNGIEGNTTTSSTVTSTTEATTSTTEVTTTTSSTSTTSTTLASSCGNAILDPGEDCDPPGNLTCPDPSSPGGAFLACNSDCTCPGASTTTTSSSTSTSTTEVTVTTSTSSTSTTTEPSVTTTSSTSTTSTTLASSCGNAMVEPGEDCDPPGNLTCPDPSSPGGAFLACNNDCTCPGASTTTTSTSSTTSSTTIGSTTSSTSSSTVTSTTAATTSSTVATTSSTSTTVATTSSTSTTAPTVTTTSSTTSTVATTSSTSTTAPTVTTTTSSTTTSTIASTCCSAERTTLSSSAGTLKVGGFAPFPFPAGVVTIIDAGAPDATCKHPVTLPAGGFAVPPFCIPALQYTSQVISTGCAVGTGDGAGFLWDGNASANGGVPMTNVTKNADSSDGVCDNSGAACANRDLNLLGDIDETISAGGVATKLAVQLDIPAHSRTWQDAAGCPGNGIYNAGEGDVLITEFDFILSPTTGVATGAFVDKNADGCALPGGSAGFGAPSAQCSAGAAGPCTASGVQADGPCCTVGQSTTVATVGAAFSNSFPLYDLGFINVVPSTVQSCGAFVSDTCTVSTDSCQF